MTQVSAFGTKLAIANSSMITNGTPRNTPAASKRNCARNWANAVRAPVNAGATMRAAGAGAATGAGTAASAALRRNRLRPVPVRCGLNSDRLAPNSSNDSPVHSARFASSMPSSAGTSVFISSADQ